MAQSFAMCGAQPTIHSSLPKADLWWATQTPPPIRQRHLHTGAWTASGRSRPATPLPRHTAFGSPDGAHPGARRADLTTARPGAQHRSAGRSRNPAGPTHNPASTDRNLCAELLGASPLIMGGIVWAMGQ